MLDKKYRLSYLPLFYEELNEKVMYIADKLKNPQAANDLLDKVERVILERRYTYYRIYVDNYIIYYVVIDDDPNDLIMEVRRFLYHGQNQQKLV